jgi:hypothetical protein
VVLHKMYSYGFNTNVIKLVGNFLSQRMQCVKFSNVFSPYVDIKVGSPQGTKLGPYLWLIYVNDLEVDGFTTVKYADDTTFYKSVHSHTSNDVILPAISATQSWAETNNMLLNADKTVIMNTSLSHQYFYKNEVVVDNCSISPSNVVKFLGVFIDNKLTCKKHVENLISKCNSRLFLMRQLKNLGLNKRGLCVFYCSNIRSILTYAAPVWHEFLTTQSRTLLESIQRSATRIIYPDFSYEERLRFLSLSPINDFIFKLSFNHFRRIHNDANHPLFSRIVFNESRRSSRDSNTKFRPAIAKTTKRTKSFFQFFMRFCNNGHIYVE